MYDESQGVVAVPGVWAGRVSSRRDREGGAALLEFALVAPLLFLLLFGVIEFARLVTGYTAVWTGAREGARFATTVGTNASGVPHYLDCAGIEAAVRAKVVAVTIGPGDIDIVYYDPTDVAIADCDDADSSLPDPTVAAVPSGSRVEVEVRGTFDAVVPLIGQFIDGATLDSTQSRSIFLGVLGG